MSASTNSAINFGAFLASRPAVRDQIVQELASGYPANWERLAAALGTTDRLAWMTADYIAGVRTSAVPANQYTRAAKFLDQLCQLSYLTLGVFCESARYVGFVGLADALFWGPGAPPGATSSSTTYVSAPTYNTLVQPSASAAPAAAPAPAAPQAAPVAAGGGGGMRKIVSVADKMQKAVHFVVQLPIEADLSDGQLASPLTMYCSSEASFSRNRTSPSR
jgi:hypothetical protein